MPYAAQLQRLSEVAAALTDALTPDAVATVIVEQAVRGAGARAGAVLLLDAAAGELVLLAAEGYDAGQLSAYRTVPLDAPFPIAEAVRRREALFLGSPEERATHFPGLHTAVIAQYPSRAWASLPLAARGQTLGVLALAFDTVQAFPADDRSFLMTLAQQCALALDRTLLLEDHQRAAAERAQTAAMVDTMLAEAPVGLCFVDRELRYVRINHALAALNGVPAADHLGRTAGEVLGEHAAGVEAVCRQVFDTGTPVVGHEWSGVAPTGRQVHLVASFYPVRDATGEIAWCGVVVVDVSELRHTVDELHARELQLRLAQQAAAAGCWELDADTGRFWLSDELRTLFALAGSGEPESITGWLSRVHPADRDATRAQLERALAIGELDMEFRYDHPVLGERCYAALGRLLPANGRARRLHGLTFDVTARREAAEALRRHQEQMQVAVEAAGLGTWRWDILTDRGQWDDHTRRMFGMEPGDAAHHTAFLDRVHPDDRARMARTLREAVERASGYQEEYRIVLPSGEIRWIADLARTHRGSDGRAVSLTGVSIDVTERRHADEQLRQVQRMESVGRLAGGMAHEINNMMSVVLGFAEFVMRNPALPGDARRDLLEVQKAAERAAGVTRQVLAFSRQQVLLPEVFDVATVVDEAHTMLRRLLGEHVEVVVERAGAAGRVRADRNQLLQALLNLAINARDAMPRGGRLTFRTDATTLDDGALREHIGTEAEPGCYARITVMDTGAGMDATTLARAFEPFFTTKNVGEGTGLGLSTVYGIVKQSGGYVWAESSPGAGARFTILLPAHDAAVPSEEGRAVPADIRGAGTVLVVEDEPLVRSMARRTLAELGYDVVEAANGEEALARAAQAGTSLRLVITDVVMPGMSGRELGERLGHDFPELPVLFVSGHPNEFAIEQGLLERGQAFLQKPFLPDVLGAAVRSLLDLARR